MPELSERTAKFRSAIAEFIESRKKEKLKGKDGDAKELERYDFNIWLSDAARRIGSLQLATHPLKATYPDAKIKDSTSLFVQGKELPQRLEIGSHNIHEYVLDATGDAASLGAYKFLTSTTVEGKAVIHWFLEDDPDAIAALDDDPEVAKNLALSFRKILRNNQLPSSHFGAKQLYWCVGEAPAEDTSYHLLQPMFSSSLAHALHANINDARFGDDNKAARQAFRDKKAAETSYREYRGLVARKLGGTKPQNISQLNSERGGVNYLLASLPPIWERERPRALLKTDSAFERFTHFGGVRRRLRALAEFLRPDPPSNIETRNRRRELEQDLGLQLLAFADSIKADFEPGWTRDEDCQLPLCEQLWLDPERIDLPLREGHVDADQDFIDAYHFADWPDEVAGRFANWLNGRLRDAGLVTVGDAEFKHWGKQAIIDAQWPVPIQRRAGVRT